MTMDEMNLPFGLGGAIESYVKGIKHAHYCELALAWMLTLDKVVEDNKEPCYRLVRVNCPVDVQVYDFSNQLVAEIKNDETSEIENSEIDAFVDNDGQKIVLLPMDEDYSVKLKATGNATMTYSVSDFSVAKSSEEHKRVYYDIPISTGDTFTDGISCIEGGEEPVTEDVLKDSRGKVINPGEEMSGSQVKTYTVTVEKTGNGTVEGGGIKTKGEFASVEAAPDSGSRFAGWYVNNKLVSSDLKYRFCVKNDITLTARFASLDNPRTAADSHMTAGQKVTWDCVWFGAYPQTEIVDKKETCGTYGKDWGKSTDYVADTKLYSKLQNATGWDSKGDLTLDGQKYRRIKKSDATYSSSGSDHYNWNDS